MSDNAMLKVGLWKMPQRWKSKERIPNVAWKAAKNAASHISHRSGGDSQQQMCYPCPGTRVTHVSGTYIIKEEGQMPPRFIGVQRGGYL
jgi:hypothetical protein